MADAEFRFHGRLNDFLPRARREGPLRHAIDRRAAIKDVIESLGVPHTEVDVILVDGRSVDFAHRLAGGERVAVYPWTVAAPVAEAHHLRPSPPAVPRFVLDAHLGKLARFLRQLGFDCRYRNDIGDAELAACADAEGRILLTRDRRLLMRRRVTLAHYLRSIDPWRQVEEVCDEFDLVPALAPFTRCPTCNGRLVPVPREAVLDRLEPMTRRHVEAFLQCEACGQLFWHGSHASRLARRIEALRQRGRP